MSSDEQSHLQQVIRFEYLQSLAWQAGNRWSEQVEARVTLTDAAFSSGWLRQHFTGKKGGATDFVILIAIVMHARPLKGDDLQYLVNLQMASVSDEGRLYARITDKGLSGELGIHRTTVAKSAHRLAEAGFITILDIPEHLTSFRDSHGQFAGSKVYLLSGELEQFLPKALHAMPNHRVALSDTDGDGLTDTVTPENGATVSLEPTHRVSSTDTNKRLRDRGGEVFKQIDPEIVFSRFAQLRSQDYVPNEKDFDSLIQLQTEGYVTEDLLQAIQRAASNLDGTLKVARSFAYVLPEIRQQPPSILGENLGSSPRSSGGSALGADSDSATLELSAVQIPTDVQQAIRLKAALALGQRLLDPAEERPAIHSPADAAALVQHEMSLLEQEYLRVILLNTRNRVIGIEEIYHGSLNSSQVRVGEIFKPAIARMAAAVIVCHNHPSGSIDASPDDIAITRAFVEAGELIDISVLDHLIIGSGGKWLSMKEKRLGFS